MNHLIHAELLQLRTTRMFYGNVLAAIAFVPFSLLIAIQTAGQPGANIPALDTSDGIRNVMSAASSGSFIVLIIGVSSWPESSATTPPPRRSSSPPTASGW